MGPVKSKIVPGRGDKYEATEQLITNMCTEDYLTELLMKFNRLDKEDQEEVSNIFDGEDIPGLLGT